MAGAHLVDVCHGAAEQVTDTHLLCTDQVWLIARFYSLGDDHQQQRTKRHAFLWFLPLAALVIQLRLGKLTNDQQFP